MASVLANQLVYYYLPAVPGWFATRSLAAARLPLSHTTRVAIPG